MSRVRLVFCLCLMVAVRRRRRNCLERRRGGDGHVALFGRAGDARGSARLLVDFAARSSRAEGGAELGCWRRIDVTAWCAPPGAGPARVPYWCSECRLMDLVRALASCGRIQFDVFRRLRLRTAFRFVAYNVDIIVISFYQITFT